jgi:hypothetical protein
MPLRRILLIVLAVAGLWQGYENWRLRPVHPADGAIAPDDPRQTDIEAPRVTVLGQWRLTARAHYDITARILGREDYRFDQLADLIPEDLALGWGAMSDNRVLEAFEITQGARFYSWRAKRRLPIPRQAVIEHSANTHIIPADRVVAGQLQRLRVGQVVHLTGYLVNGVRQDGTYLNTSLTRSDSGPGSCEVVLVEAVEAW